MLLWYDNAKFERKRKAAKKNMRVQYNPYIWPLIASALITLTLTAYAALRRRGARGAGAFILNMTMLSVWALSAALEVSAADLPTALFFANMQYAGYCYFPVTLLAACLIFSGYDEWAKLRKLWWLGIVPTIIFALVWTDALHGLVRYDMRLDYAGPFPVIDKKYGPALYVNAAYAYALLLTSCALLLRRAIGGNRLYRRQMLVLFAGVSATIVPNMLYTFGLGPVEWLDITPMFFGPAGLLLAWGMFRFKILDIVPLARATLIETMNSGVMVLDLQERVLDINPFLARMLGISASAAITRGTREVCGGIPALAAACADPEAAHAEFAVRTGDASRVYEALFSPLCDGKGARIGGNGGIVVISGGSVNANSIQAAPTNGSGATVYRTVVTLSGVTTATKVTSLTAALGYGINDMYTDADGKPYLYLPADTHTTAAQTTDGATPPVLTSYTGDIVTVTGGTAACTLSIPSSDAALSGLSISSGTLNPIFASGTYAYTASVANGVDSVNIAATKSHANATMTLQKGSGSAAAWNGASIVQSLDVGANVFTITVTAQDGTSTQDYTVTVTRKASEPGNLYVPRTLTDPATGIAVSGDAIHRDAQLSVHDNALHFAGACAACDAIRAHGGRRAHAAVRQGHFPHPGFHRHADHHLPCREHIRGQNGDGAALQPRRTRNVHRDGQKRKGEHCRHEPVAVRGLRARRHRRSSPNGRRRRGVGRLADVRRRGGRLHRGGRAQEEVEPRMSRRARRSRKGVRIWKTNAPRPS